MQNKSAVDWVIKLILVAGGLNWGLVGLFGFDLVAAIFGGADSAVSRVIYVVVGLSALWVLVKLFTKK